jgi:hypothetical protein
MTNSTTPGYPGSNDDSLGASTTTGTTRTTGTTGTTYESTSASTPGAREEAANLAGEAGDAGRRVAGVAKEETKAVGSEARRQARRLADQVGSEVRQQAATQQSRAAGGLRNIGDEFSHMADGSGSGSGFAADVAREAGQRVGAVAQWLDQRDPRDLLEEVKGFARRRPGVFLAIAVGAGVVVGRLTRALVTPSGHGHDDRAPASTGRPVSAYGTGTAGTAGIPGVADSEVIVTGTTAETPVDPVTGQSWPQGTPATTRGGI